MVTRNTRAVSRYLNVFVSYRYDANDARHYMKEAFVKVFKQLPVFFVL